jgi:LysM repeat protein
LAKLILLPFSLFLLLLLWGCSTPTDVVPLEPTITLKPYSPPSSTPTSTFVIPTMTVHPTVGPTATPFVHVVEKDDTLLGIAIRYGVNLEDLLAVNPGINPTILSIGQKIIIPGPEGDSESIFLPVATPYPLTYSEVDCFPTTTHQLWCITTLVNQEGYPLEGVSVILSLLNDKGEVIQSCSAFSPLNLIPEGGVIPLAALFPSPPKEYAYAMVLPVTANQATNIEGRYLPLEWILETNEAKSEPRTWRIAGKLFSLSESERRAVRVTILGAALGEKGNVVGFRQMEVETELGSGDELPFEMEVFSLGPPIDHVEILAEAMIVVEVE